MKKLILFVLLSFSLIGTVFAEKSVMRYDGDEVLYNKISKETVTRINVDKLLNEKIIHNSKRITDLEDKIKELEIILGIDIRILDAKYIAIYLFNNYDIKQKKNKSTGIKVTLKIGKSYEEKRIEKIEQLLKIILEGEENE